MEKTVNPQFTLVRMSLNIESKVYNPVTNNPNWVSNNDWGLMGKTSDHTSDTTSSESAVWV